MARRHINKNSLIDPQWHSSSIDSLLAWLCCVQPAMFVAAQGSNVVRQAEKLEALRVQHRES